MRSLIPFLALFVAACGAESNSTPATPQKAPAGGQQEPAVAGTHEELAAEVVAVLRQQVELLEKVTDAATAAEYRDRIRELSRKLADLKVRQQKLGDPTDEQQAALEAKYSEELQALFKRQGQIGMRFAKDPKIEAALRGGDSAARDSGPADPID